VNTWTERAADAATFVRREAGGLEKSPVVGIVLGSGLGSVAADVADAIRIATASIPHFPPSTVAGHAGELLLGRVGECPVAVLSGRVHGYEGHAPAVLGFPVRVLHALGCRVLVVTNAAGALNPDFRPGEVMLIEDHLSFPSVSGGSPLVGPAREEGLPRFVDLTDAYAPRLRELALAVAARNGDSLRRGVYVMVGGPNFETPAEVRFLRQVGGDAVGMSTVPEVIVARQLGVDVLGLSVLSNLAAGLPGALLSHDDVLRSVEGAAPVVGRTIRGVVAELVA
jgi:purine-nucleoside phosphorylase